MCFQFQSGEKGPQPQALQPPDLSTCWPRGQCEHHRHWEAGSSTASTPADETGGSHGPSGLGCNLDWRWEDLQGDSRVCLLDWAQVQPHQDAGNTPGVQGSNGFHLLIYEVVLGAHTGPILLQTGPPLMVQLHQARLGGEPWKDRGCAHSSSCTLLPFPPPRPLSPSA